MNYVGYLTGNRAINAAIIAWLIAQLIKIIITYIGTKRIDFTRLVGAGGMPSSHTAFVVALATSIAKTSGYGSVQFAIAFCFTLIVMYDAAGVRRAAGEQAKILNYMMDNWAQNTPDVFQKKLIEFLGHTPFQVIIGMAIGILCGIIL